MDLKFNPINIINAKYCDDVFSLLRKKYEMTDFNETWYVEN